jgi:peroxiredoxin
VPPFGFPRDLRSRRGSPGRDCGNGWIVFFFETVDFKIAKTYIYELEMKSLIKSVMDNVNVIRSGFFAIDFTLTDTQGDVFHLKDNLTDHFTCLVFFPDGEIEKINNYLKVLNHGLPGTASGLPVNIIGICPDKVSRLNQVRNKLKLDFPILSDPGLLVSSRYYVADESSARPAVYFSIFIVDDEGVIRYRLSEVPGFSKFAPDELKESISRLI